MKRVVTGVVVVVVAALLGWQIYERVQEQAAAEAGGSRPGGAAVPVEVTPVRTATVRDVAEFTGTLLPRAQFVVAPKVSGRLVRLLVDIGDHVKNGDPVAELDSDEYAQEVAQASAELEVSKANLADSKSALDVADREFQRAKELREQKVASEAELDQAEAHYRAAEAKYQVAQAQIKQRDAALKTAQVRLSYTSIQASWEDGEGPRLIAERFADQGAMLRANDPIVSVVDASTVIAVINVIERDFPDVLIGQPAVVTTDAYGDREFAGRIARRAPVLREESRQARVEVEIPNPDGLLAPGMFVRARIQFAEHEGATVVPTAALARRGKAEGVFLADTAQKVAHFVPVKLGIRDGDVVEVLDPPLKGMVITLGQHLLEDGGAIRVPEGAPGSAGAAPGARP